MSIWDTEALSIHDCKPPGLSRRSCELHAGRRLFARNAGWHIRQEYVVRASPDADDRIAAKTDGEGVSRHLDFYRLRPCLFLKFDAGYGRLGKRSPLSVICSAGGYTAPIAFEDDVYSLVFSAARDSESLRHVDYEVVVDCAVINNRRRGAGRQHALGYGMLAAIEFLTQ